MMRQREKRSKINIRRLVYDFTGLYSSWRRPGSGNVRQAARNRWLDAFA
jgi:hypothetical protein